MSTTIEKGPTGRIKGLRQLLQHITLEDVVKAIDGYSIEVAAEHGFAESTNFDLVHDGQRLPPKAILGLAASRTIGRPLLSSEFSGGDSSPCFAVLRGLGFTIERKQVAALVPSANAALIRLQAYNREEIAHIFEPEAKFTPGAGRWGMPGIVETPRDSGDFVFMVTLGKPDESNPYQDALTLDGRLIWESQTQQGFDSQTIRKLLTHDPMVNNVHLFLRAKKGDKYTYFGLLNYFSHDPNKHHPVHFIWTVQNWDIGQDQLKHLGIPVLASLDPAFSLSPPVAVTALLTRTDPPVIKAKPTTGTQPKKKSKGGEVDWAARDLRNRQLGLQGEKLVLQHEITMLKAAGRPDLADKVQHVALTDCTAGYDIATFHVDGRAKRIEVKATQGPAATPFYISMNEVLASRDEVSCFSIYRIFGLSADSEQIQFFELEGDVEDHCGLDPISFRATPGANQTDD